MKNKTFNVVGIGELLWDLLPDAKKLGGAPTNFAFHTQKMGAESKIISAIGNDSLGKEILELFKKMKLNSDFVQIDDNKQTGIVNVMLNNGIPDYEIKTDVAWDFIQWNTSMKQLALSTDAVCFGSLAQRSEISRLTIHKFIQSTRKDCLRVFDVNLRQNFFTSEILVDSLKLANILKLNDEELPVVAEMFSLKGDENVILDKLIDIFDLKLIALTKGSNGSILKSRDEKSFLEVPKVEVKDTVGAGDSFTATLIMSFLNGKSLEEMHQTANKIAAFVCSRDGATPELPQILIERMI